MHNAKTESFFVMLKRHETKKVPRCSENRVIVVPVLHSPPFHRGVAEQHCLMGSKNRSILWVEFYESLMSIETPTEG